MLKKPCSVTTNAVTLLLLLPSLSAVSQLDSTRGNQDERTMGMVMKPIGASGVGPHTPSSSD